MLRIKFITVIFIKFLFFQFKEKNSLLIDFTLLINIKDINSLKRCKMNKDYLNKCNNVLFVLTLISKKKDQALQQKLQELNLGLNRK